MEYTGFAIPSNYSDDDEIYQFPLDYTNYDSSTYAVSFTLSTLLSLSQSGYRINEVDGYGTVITPYGTFSCLKVKTTLVETDSLTINGIALPPVTRTTRQNKWLSTAEKIPVFEVDGNVLFGSFVPTYARYRDNYLIPAGIDGVTYTEPGMVIYPNPTSSSLTVCLPSAQNGSAEFDNYDELIITDATGKTVYQKEFLNLGHSCSDGNRYQSIQTSNLPSGIYFLRLRTPDGFYSSKFIKE